MGRKEKHPKQSQIGTGVPTAKQKLGGLGAFAAISALLFLALGPAGCALTGSGSNSQPPPSTLSITTASLPGGQQQSSYSAALNASGGNTPYSWTISSGALPQGLSLTSATGQISGTVTGAGTFGFTVQVDDSSSPLQSAKHDYSIQVAAGTSQGSGLTITTTSLPAGQVSQAYSATLQATGGKTPYSWSLAANSGPLPGGLTLDAATGTISGTPAAASSYNFTVQVSDSSAPSKTGFQALAISTLGVALDQYGAREDINCATITPYFHL